MTEPLKSNRYMTRERLLEAFEYDPASGVLKWRGDRPLNHFHTTREQNIWRTKYAGQIVGNDDGQGYLRVSVSGIKMRVHRIAWIMVHGEIPDEIEIDHRNCVRRDNRMANLRLASSAENLRNTKHRSDNTSGARGVCWNKNRRKWLSRITVDGREISLGFFTSKDEAAAAYRSASLRYCGEFSPFNQ